MLRSCGGPSRCCEVDRRQVVFWGSSDRFVSAHAALDGELLWIRELVAPTNTQAEALVPSPFYDHGVLYVAWFVYDKALATNRQDAHLAAFDAATGRLLWQRELCMAVTMETSTFFP